MINDLSALEIYSLLFIILYFFLPPRFNFFFFIICSLYLARTIYAFIVLNRYKKKV